MEEANGGLLILEEIGELPLEVQAMLLTFIETGEYRKIGENETRRADVQIVGATNRESSLRDDFRYRFYPFYIPPIRERRGDVLYYLFDKYTDLTQALYRSEVLVLLSYNWPGNVREIERIAKLLMREKSLDDLCYDEDSYLRKLLPPYNLLTLQKKDTALDPRLLGTLVELLIDRGVDLDLIQSLLSKKRVSFGREFESYAFEELEDTREIPGENMDDEYSIKFYDDYEPFKEAYEGYLAFCGLFLPDPLKDKNILADLSDCSFSHFNLDFLDFPKNKKKRVHESAKEIMKFLKGIKIKEYKWPTDMKEFWLALEDINEEYYGKQSLSGEKPSEESIEKIYSMKETDLRKLYYNGLLKRTGGSVTLAAKMADLKTTTFAERLKKLDIKSSRRKD